MRPLRSNFEIGTSRWAVRRAQWRALGLTDEDMTKPKVAVVNSSSELAICFSHLDGVAKVVKEGVRAAGGLPFEIRTAAPSDFIHSAGRAATYLLPSRDLIANDIELQVEGAQLDGMVCLASCDKTLPGQVMAAARMNIPTIVVICGYQPSGEIDGAHVDIEEVFLGAGHHAAGKITLERLTEMSEQAIRGPGVCSGMGTANSMHSVCEALGLCLPGSAPVLANSEAMFGFARASGERIVGLIEADLRPRDILKPEAFANAAAMVLALSGSINCIKHLQAMAVEAESDVDVYRLFDELADRIPVITATMPSGPHSIEALEAAGGAGAVLKRLLPLISGAPLTVTGKTAAENLAGIAIADDEVIRPLERPYSAKPAIVMLKGSLAPTCGIVKLGLREAGRPLAFRGPARVFENSPDAEAALKAGRIGSGDVVVLRGMGVKGGPGMGGASRFVFALDGAGLGGEIAVVTDGQLSGLVNKGLVVGEVEPEAAVGGPLGLVEDGDVIALDIEARSAELEVAGDVLAERRSRFHNQPPTRDSGWLSIYERTVTPLSRGATLVDRRGGQ
jgi:dihydroxy-acid dehydratase